VRFNNIGGVSVLCIFISLIALTREVNAQEFNGIALIKPFSHSKETDVSQAIIYDSYTTRPTFFTFDFNGVKQKIDTGLVAKIYNIPNPDKITNIEQETDVSDIRLSIPRIEYVLNRFKLSENLESALKNRLDSLRYCIKSFDENQIKKNAVWIDKNKYTAEVERKKLERQLKEQEENKKLEEIRLRENEAKRVANEIKEKKRIVIQGKLDAIKFERIDFTDANINEVIDYLREKSKELDVSSVESEKGVNIILVNPENEDIDLTTCRMRNASLGEVINLLFSTNLGLLTQISESGIIVSMPARPKKEQQFSVKNQTKQIIQAVCIMTDFDGISMGCKIKFFSDQTVLILNPSDELILAGVYKTTPKKDFFEIIWRDLPNCKSAIEFNQLNGKALLAIEPVPGSGLPTKGAVFRILP
jgi:hypothetical protein